MSKLFLPNYMNDAALYHATLAIAAVHVDAINGRASSWMSLLYRGEAIRLVNRDLGCPKKCVSDTTIAAVALLAGMEVSATLFCSRSSGESFNSANT